MTHWYALHAKPHKERQVSSYLKTEGYEVYLPTVRIRRRGKARAVPFFSCYLFARMDGLADFADVRWTPGLRSIVGFGDRPAVVPDEAIELIKKRLVLLHGRGGTATLLRPGDQVLIRSGPLAHLQGVFQEGLSSGDRARVLVDCLGRWRRCEVDIASLRKVY